MAQPIQGTRSTGQRRSIAPNASAHATPTAIPPQLETLYAPLSYASRNVAAAATTTGPPRATFDPRVRANRLGRTSVAGASCRSILRLYRDSGTLLRKAPPPVAVACPRAETVSACARRCFNDCRRVPSGTGGGRRPARQSCRLNLHRAGSYEHRVKTGRELTRDAPQREQGGA